MTKEETIKALLTYNKWRQGKGKWKGNEMPYAPSEITDIIKSAIKHLTKND